MCVKKLIEKLKFGYEQVCKWRLNLILGKKNVI